MGGEVVTCCQMELIEAKSAFWLMIWGPEEGGRTKREFFRHEITSVGSEVAACG